MDAPPKSKQNLGNYENTFAMKVLKKWWSGMNSPIPVPAGKGRPGRRLAIHRVVCHRNNSKEDWGWTLSSKHSWKCEKMRNCSNFKKLALHQAWWCLPLFAAHGMLKWVNSKFQVSVGYIGRACLKSQLRGRTQCWNICLACARWWFFFPLALWGGGEG